MRVYNLIHYDKVNPGPIPQRISSVKAISKPSIVFYQLSLIGSRLRLRIGIGTPCNTVTTAEFDISENKNMKEMVDCIVGWGLLVFHAYMDYLPIVLLICLHLCQALTT